MDNFDKNNLDALFQEGSERYDFTYREDAWASMDQMLDDQEKKRTKGFFGWWLLAGITVLVGVFGLKFYGEDHSTLTHTDMARELTTTPLRSMNEAITEETPAQITAILTEETITESVDQSNALAEVIATADLPAKVNNNSEPTSDQYPALPPKIETIQSVVETAQILPSTIQNESTIATNINTTEATSEIVSRIPQAVIIKENPVILPSGTLTLLIESPVDYSAIALPEIVLVEPIEKADDVKLTNRFSVGLTVGPEYSFLGGTKNAKAGYYAGLELGYQLSNHFELVTGVGVSRKRYIGAGNEYKAKAGFWTDEIVPMEFSGVCTVIEIPLAVNYYFNDAKENGWFASLGATTYVMTDEWYGFTYDPSVDRSDLKSSWQNDTSHNHLLGVGQVSFGYQKNIGKHTTLQISPYAKIPLTGIGHGSVNLFSTGLRVTARLR